MNSQIKPTTIRDLIPSYIAALRQHYLARARMDRAEKLLYRAREDKLPNLDEVDAAYRAAEFAMSRESWPDAIEEAISHIIPRDAVEVIAKGIVLCRWVWDGVGGISYAEPEHNHARAFACAAEAFDPIFAGLIEACEAGAMVEIEGVTK